MEMGDDVMTVLMENWIDMKVMDDRIEMKLLEGKI